MLGFIIFSIKIVFAAAIGALLQYEPNKELEKYKIIESSLICIFGASILSLSTLGSENSNEFSIGAGIISVILAIVIISKNKDFIDKMLWFFSGISGMLIGSGYILQSIILIVLVYNILQNNDRIVDYFNPSNNKEKDDFVENITN